VRFRMIYQSLGETWMNGTQINLYLLVTQLTGQSHGAGAKGCETRWEYYAEKVMVMYVNTPV